MRLKLDRAWRAVAAYTLWIVLIPFALLVGAIQGTARGLADAIYEMGDARRQINTAIRTYQPRSRIRK